MTTCSCLQTPLVWVSARPVSPLLLSTRKALGGEGNADPRWAQGTGAQQASTGTKGVGFASEAGVLPAWGVGLPAWASERVSLGVVLRADLGGKVELSRPEGGLSAPVAECGAWTWLVTHRERKGGGRGSLGSVWGSCVPPQGNYEPH